MIKNILEDIKLSYVSYLLDKLKSANLDTKFKVFKKLDKMKISTLIGLEILEASVYDFNVKDGYGGINSSLVSLCLKDYKKEYGEMILKYFNKYDDDCQNQIVYLLSFIDNEDALKLYADLILKYFKDKKIIPIGNLYERVDSYKILFPKLFKAVKFNNYRNNILLLINDYLNAGVIPDADLNKNKKLLQTAVSKIINDALKFKFSSTTKALQNDKYIEIRMYLEIVINIEYFVSSPTTRKLIDRLYKKNDNQLKLFIIDNYIRKLKKIEKLNFDLIARDKLSRYPLYELLTFYKKEDLFPKKYFNQKDIAESDLYINFLIYNKYQGSLTNIKYVKEIEINNYKYYVFTFKYTYQKNTEYDSTTNYIIEGAGIEKYKNQKVTSTFVGLSGGYNQSKEISLVETTNDKILWHLKKNNESIDDVIEKIKNESFEIEKVKEEIPKSLKKEEKKVKEDIKEIEKEPEKKEILEETLEVEEKKKKRFKFGYILTFLFLVLLLCIGAFLIFLKNPELINIENNKLKVRLEDATAPTVIKNKDKFKEINGVDIFNQEEGNYYVLLFKRTNKSSYYSYINTLVQNGYTIYYIDLKKEENRFLYQQNDLNFTVSVDRYVKVEDKDYSFYVDNKENILDELKLEVKEVEKANKKKTQEKNKTKNEEKK